MDTKALRQKVLDLAIRGKLVPQDPNDEPASVLLERIRQQKQQMVKDGKLKAKDIKNDSIIFVGEDNLHYEKFADGSVKCIEDEIPFELPDGWAWSRMGSLCEYITSGSRGWAQYYSDTGSLFLRMGNLSRDSFELRMDNLQRVDLPDNVEGTRTRVAENDLLFSITAEIGMLGLIPANFEEAYINQHVGLIRFLKEAQTKYFPYILMSAFCRDQYYTVQSGMKNSFRLDNIQSILAPVPPLGEQIRITEKLNSIWLHIQQIDGESETASDIISKAKSKILDLAIHGQLVPQDPADEPASVLLERIRAEKEELIRQGKIKRDKKESVIFRGEDNSYYEKISNKAENIDNEIPFELPEGWEFVRLKGIWELISGRDLSSSEYNADGTGIPYITGASNFIDGKVELVRWTTSPQVITEAGDLLLTCKGTVGEMAFNTFGSAHIARQIMAIRNTFALNSEYLALCMGFYINAIKNVAKGLIPGISREDILNLILPVPPLNYQARVVERVAALTNYLIAIEKSLS